MQNVDYFYTVFDLQRTILLIVIRRIEMERHQPVRDVRLTNELTVDIYWDRSLVLEIVPFGDILHKLPEHLGKGFLSYAFMLPSKSMKPA